MNRFELQALRRILFFNRMEAAKLLAANENHPYGVTDRSWRMWEDGSRTIPADVIERVHYLIGWRGNAIQAALSQIGQAEPSAEVRLVWYETLDDWHSLAGRDTLFFRPTQSVIAALLAADNRFGLVVFDFEAYTDWLGKRDDSEKLRSLWGHSFPSDTALL